MRIMLHRPYDTDEYTTTHLDIGEFRVKFPWIKPLFDTDPKQFKEPKWYGISTHLFDREMQNAIMIYYGTDEPLFLYAPWRLDFVGYGPETDHVLEYLFFDKVNNNVVATKAHTLEQHYRWRCLKWFKWWTIKHKRLEIEFSEEVGEDIYTWKGGVDAMTTSMDKDETTIDAIRRVEVRGV